MIMCNQTLTSAVQNRLICTCLPKLQKAREVRRKYSVKFNEDKFLGYISNTSIKPYINTKKLYLVKPFMHTRKVIKCTYNFVADEDVAGDIACKVLSYIPNKSIIAEGNPGVGLITIKLINSNVDHVLLFENSQIQQFSISQLLREFPSKVTKKSHNMNIQPELVILNGLDFSQKNGLPWTFIGAATSFYFLRSLVLTAVKYKLWEHNMDVFLLLSTPVLDVLKRGGTMIKFSLYSGFHVLYNITEIESYPRSAFLPYCAQDKEDMILVRIKSNPNLFQLLKKEELSEYFIFILLLGVRRHNLIIPSLEKWLSDCGPYLISKGISMTNQVQDLTPHETIVLFNFFKECDGYDAFKAYFSEIYKNN